MTYITKGVFYVSVNSAFSNQSVNQCGPVSQSLHRIYAVVNFPHFIARGFQGIHPAPPPPATYTHNQNPVCKSVQTSQSEPSFYVCSKTFPAVYSPWVQRNFLCIAPHPPHPLHKHTHCWNASAIGMLM